MKFGLLIKFYLNLALVALFPSLATACAVCVTGAGNDSTTDAYNWSVLFLMAAPYVVVGSVVGWLVYAYRRAAKRLERSEGTQTVIHLALNQKESGR
jgi:heme/copper-type cytochrome/quinol oxidase subunit 2